jgi:hypothetical protein
MYGRPMACTDANKCHGMLLGSGTTRRFRYSIRRPRPGLSKKTRKRNQRGNVIEHREAFDRVGLLIDKPRELAGLPFI